MKAQLYRYSRRTSNQAEHMDRQESVKVRVPIVFVLVYTPSFELDFEYISNIWFGAPLVVVEVLQLQVVVVLVVPVPEYELIYEVRNYYIDIHILYCIFYRIEIQIY